MKSTKKRPVPLHRYRQPPETNDRDYLSEKNTRNFCEITSLELSKALGVIAGELDYGLFKPSTVEKEHSMHIALTAAREAMALARNLKYFSAQQRLDMQTVDVSQLVLDTVDLVEKDLAAQKICFKVLVEAATLAILDPNSLQQALLNVFLRCSQAMAGGGLLTVMLKKHRDTFEIRISDTAESQFSDANETVATNGTQLGLMVARTLVEAHGGEYTATSSTATEPGNMILMTLPIAANTAKTPSFTNVRKFRRVNMHLPVEITFQHGQNGLKTNITVLSEGGCYARIPEAKLMRLPEINERVAVRLYYFETHSVEVRQARIASVCWAGSLSGIGVDFLEVDERGQKLLRALVKTHSF